MKFSVATGAAAALFALTACNQPGQRQEPVAAPANSLATAVQTSSAVSSVASHASTPLPTLQCGDTLTQDTNLTADLVCPSTTGFALNVRGSNVTLDGKGHKIVAPLAAAGVFVSGRNHAIRNLTVNGVSGGDGILAYEAPGVKLTNNDVSGNLQGIVVYADSGAVDGVEISNNVARSNGLFGVRTSYDLPGSILDPKIHNNDLGGSGSYGLHLKATTLDLGGDQNNSFAGSANGIYLAGGDVTLENFSLAREGLLGVGVFADSLASLSVNNVDVSSSAPAGPSQGRIGIDLYRVGRFSIQKLTATGNDVGVKFETERGVSSTGTITGSAFRGEAVSGILVVSYDETPYGRLNFTQNCYALSAGVPRVLLQPGTLVGAGSVLDDGLNVCNGNGH